MTLEELYQIINPVIPNKVFYGTNVYDNEDNASLPYIVYQEVSKRAKGYIDDVPIAYELTIQITLVTKKKDLIYEKKLENALLSNCLNYRLISEFTNEDKSVNRVYEIIMEEI